MATVTDSVPIGAARFRVANGQPGSVAIHFDRRESISGLWRRLGGVVHSSCPERADSVAVAAEARTWDERIGAGDTDYQGFPIPKAFEPVLAVSLSTAAACLHRTMQVHATMDIEYPKTSVVQQGAAFFSNERAVVTRRISLLVLSQEEIRLADSYGLWERRRQNWPFGVAGVGLFALGVLLWRRGASRAV